LRLSDLLGAEVVDRGGHSAGRVHDVRLVQDGPVLGGFGAGLRVDGLVVGRRAVGARLGYERGRMRGPLLVKLVAGWLRHDGRYVPWDRVEAISEDRILISGSADDLPQPTESQ
jgi:sporulation protein YlmC with PRC-barrel domain